jgi:cytidylate kinase
MTRQNSRDLQKIIEDQFRIWAKAAAPNQVHTTWPLITISRQYGALGTTIGRLLAQQLTFSLWDQELVHAIAEDSGVSEELVRSVDERWPNTLNEILSNLLIGPRGTEADYVRQIYRIIHTLEKRGRGVVIGRGSQFIVKPAKALRVRCIASLPIRTERVMATEHLDKTAALKKIAAMDGERRHFHKHYFAQDVDDPCHYHLVVNTGAMTAEQAVAAIVTAYQQLFGKP